MEKILISPCPPGISAEGLLCRHAGDFVSDLGLDVEFVLTVSQVPPGATLCVEIETDAGLVRFSPTLGPTHQTIRRPGARYARPRWQLLHDTGGPRFAHTVMGVYLVEGATPVLFTLSVRKTKGL
jgi:hypothetical protein